MKSPEIKKAAGPSLNFHFRVLIQGLECAAHVWLSKNYLNQV